MTQDTKDPDMVERVANAAMASLHGYAGMTISPDAALHVAQTTLEACHHAELVEENKRLRFDLGNMTIRCRHLLQCEGVPAHDLSREDRIFIDDTRQVLAKRPAPPEFPPGFDKPHPPSGGRVA